MRFRWPLISAVFAAGLAVLPLSIAQAQYYHQYYPPCSPFPLTWPFCVVDVAVGIAATIVTLPVRVLTGAPPYYYGYYWPSYYPPPPYYPPRYYPPPYNGPR